MATYGEFRGPTYGDLGQTATATYGEFGVIVLAPSRGLLVLSELTSSLHPAEMLVDALTESESAPQLVGAETKYAALTASEARGSELVISEV